MLSNDAREPHIVERCNPDFPIGFEFGTDPANNTVSKHCDTRVTIAGTWEIAFFPWVRW